MLRSLKIQLKNEELYLLPYKAIYWKKNKALILSDLHLGKASHFRKEGIALPSRLLQANLQKLDELFTSFDIEVILIIGDMFHSDYNKDWTLIGNWIKSNKPKEFVLVKGNHDILDVKDYKNAKLHVVDTMEMDPFVFSHEVIESDLYCISGHIHPAIKIKKRGMPSLSLPCFHFGKKVGYLPSYGEFTGSVPLKKKAGSMVYAIAGDEIIPV